ncbi:MAG: hypothetical protein IJ688_02690 [Treponema sp.]|nr:hypothetical protein [Treponema sp.]
MLVLIPHPTEILKLRKIQSQILKSIAAGCKKRENYEALGLYTSLPLWIPLPFLDSLKNAKIEKAMMTEPTFFNDRICSKVKVFYDGKDEESELILVKSLKEKKIPEVPLDFSKDFPMEFRIFRLGIAEKLSENAEAISESIWVKNGR